MSEEVALTGERLFFRCGHERLPDNIAPKGVQHRTGKPAFRCRTCLNAKEAQRYRDEPGRRQRNIERKRRERRLNRKPTMHERIAELERENALLREELNATIEALIEARRHRDSDRNPTGEDRETGLRVKHESAGPKDIARKDTP